MSGEPHIREVRPDELEEVWRVHVAASHDRPPAPGDAPVASDTRAALASDPDGYFCAVEEGRIRGMVSALVRGRVWYLSMFFVLPGDQGRGLGRVLLERALAYGDARGAEVRCTSATLDPRAQTRYVMAGMAPRWPIYRLDGMPRRWRGSRRGSGSTDGNERYRAIPAPPRSSRPTSSATAAPATWNTGGTMAARRWRSPAVASSPASPTGGGNGSARRRGATRRRSCRRWQPQRHVRTAVDV